MQIKDFTLSKHAIERILDMGIDPSMIRECLTNPTTVQPSRLNPGHQNLRRGQITCGVAPDNTVVTVVWSKQSGWRKDLLDRGSYGGREYRGARAHE
jgi:hypothetical protein